MKDPLAAPPRERIPGLEGLRGLAALTVFFYHFVATFYPAMLIGPRAPAHSPLDMILYHSPLRFAWDGIFAVCIFFVLSGYVLTHAFFVTGRTEVLTQRALARYVRLGVPAAASILFVFTLLGADLYFVKQCAPLTGADQLVPFDRFFEFRLTVQRFLRESLFLTWFAFRRNERLTNPVLWTMPIEFLGSMLCFAAAALLHRARGRAVLLSVVALLVLRFAGPYSVYFCDLLVGVALASRDVPSRRRKGWWVSGVLLLGLYLGGFHRGSSSYASVSITGRRILGPWWNEPLVQGAAAVLVVWAVLRSPAVHAILASRVPQFLGRISFSFYLLHLPLIYSLGMGLMLWSWGRLPYNVATAAIFVVLATVTLSLAALMDRFVDKPAIRLGRSLARALTRG